MEIGTLKKLKLISETDPFYSVNSRIYKYICQEIKKPNKKFKMCEICGSMENIKRTGICVNCSVNGKYTKEQILSL